MEVIMRTLLDLTATQCNEQLARTYFHLFGQGRSPQLTLAQQANTLVFRRLAQTNALYHNAEHTLLVTVAGQKILQGKHFVEGTVTPNDWLHMTLAMLCHDIGFVSGACRLDDVVNRRFHTGIDEEMVILPVGSTDARLSSYHIDRGKQFAVEQFGDRPEVDIALVQQHIEMTRFPAPQSSMYNDTRSYGGLTRAADLIGQLSDPQYLQKTTALFYEFAETGANEALGYRYPEDVLMGYPEFFSNVVLNYIGDAIAYLDATLPGKTLLNRLYRNIEVANQVRSQRQKAPSSFLSAC